jgi:hypothetical protein
MKIRVIESFGFKGGKMVAGKTYTVDAADGKAFIAAGIAVACDTKTAAK